MEEKQKNRLGNLEVALFGSVPLLNWLMYVRSLSAKTRKRMTPFLGCGKNHQTATGRIRLPLAATFQC